MKNGNLPPIEPSKSEWDAEQNGETMPAYEEET